MTSISINHQVPVRNLQLSLQAISKSLRSEDEVRKKRKEENTKCAVSLAFTAFASIVGGLTGYKISQKFNAKEMDEDPIINKVVGFVSAGFITVFCYRYVIHTPMSREGIRRFINEDFMLQKMIFSKKFDLETTEALHEIVQVCPITMGFPRFPMRDNRLNSNGLPKVHIYDWAVLQIVLSQPIGKRSCDALNYASEENFELCEDLCSRIHHILFAKGEISSENPEEALVNEIKCIQ